MTVWLVGEAPTRHTTVPFVGQAGNRLCQMSGFDVRKAFECTNVIDHWPGPGKSKGAAFPVDQARRGVDRLLKQVIQRGDRIILVGGRVAHRAFQMNRDVPNYEWNVLSDVVRGSLPLKARVVEVALIPHPSGVNQHWNDPKNVQRLREFMESTRRLSETSRVCGDR